MDVPPGRPTSSRSSTRASEPPPPPTPTPPATSPGRSRRSSPAPLVRLGLGSAVPDRRHAQERLRPRPLRAVPTTCRIDAPTRQESPQPRGRTPAGAEVLDPHAGRRRDSPTPHRHDALGTTHEPSIQAGSLPRSTLPLTTTTIRISTSTTATDDNALTPRPRATPTTATPTASSTARSSAPAPASKPSRSASPSSASPPRPRSLIFALSGSVALLADLIHNFGDALTAIPLGIAFFLRSFRGEKLAGLVVVARHLRLRLRRALRDDPTLHPPAAPHPPLGARRRRRDRLRRQRDRRPGPAPRRDAGSPARP